MTKLIASFRNFANAPKNEKYITKSCKVVALNGIVHRCGNSIKKNKNIKS